MTTRACAVTIGIIHFVLTVFISLALTIASINSATRSSATPKTVFKIGTAVLVMLNPVAAIASLFTRHSIGYFIVFTVASSLVYGIFGAALYEWHTTRKPK
jgi:hypothetical protein